MLVDDEAYYAMYARHLSWGYIDHGPVVGFLIWVSTIMGENDFTVRISALFLMTLLSVIIYVLGKNNFSHQSAIILSLCLSANLLFHVNSIIITPDAPMAFFSILAIFFYYLAYFKNQNFLYLGGIMLGMALLSKISALFPAIGIALSPLLIKEKRHILKNIHFYASFLIAFMIFAPFILWNLENDMAFFRYQGNHISRGGSINDFFEHWLGLGLLAGPLFFYFSVIRPILNIREWNTISSDMKYFTMVTIIPLTYFLIHSFFTRLELNWAAPVFYGGLFLLGLRNYETKEERRWLKLQIGYSLLLIILIMVQSFHPIIPAKGKSDPTNRHYMYQSLIENTRLLLKENPELNNYRIVSNKFQIPSIINFYLNPKLESICLSIGYHETLFSFIYDDSEFIGDDFIYIHHKTQFPDKLKPFFESFELLTIATQFRNKAKVSNHTIWLVKNYTGKV